MPDHSRMKDYHMIERTLSNIVAISLQNFHSLRADGEDSMLAALLISILSLKQRNTSSEEQVSTCGCTFLLVESPGFYRRRLAANPYSLLHFSD